MTKEIRKLKTYNELFNETPKEVRDFFVPYKLKEVLAEKEIADIEIYFRELTGGVSAPSPLVPFIHKFKKDYAKDIRCDNRIDTTLYEIIVEELIRAGEENKRNQEIKKSAEEFKKRTCAYCGKTEKMREFNILLHYGFSREDGYPGNSSYQHSYVPLCTKCSSKLVKNAVDGVMSKTTKIK